MGLIGLTVYEPEMSLKGRRLCSQLQDLKRSQTEPVFQINARTELALRYNDISPLENHHCAVAFEILEKVKNSVVVKP